MGYVENIKQQLIWWQQNVPYLWTNFSSEVLSTIFPSSKDSGRASFDGSMSGKLKINDDSSGSGATLDGAKEPPSDWKVPSRRSFFNNKCVE